MDLLAGDLSGRHVVAVPSLGQGHINPLMNLCKRLAESGMLITFVVTEDWLEKITSSGKVPPPSNIRLRSIPNVAPLELERGLKHVEFVEAVFTKMEEPFERVVAELDPPPAVILADAFLPWAADVGKRRNIPTALMWPMSAAAFLMIYSFDLLVEHGHFPANVAEMGDTYIDYIPGIPPTHISDLPSIFHSKHPNIGYILQMIRTIPTAQWLLLNTCYELEPVAVSSIRVMFDFPVYTIGPSLPLVKPTDHLIFKTSYRPEENSCYAWLDAQRPNSVLYVSLGSFLTLSTQQMEELAYGLKASKHKFLWVVREHSALVRDIIVHDEEGLLVKWCDQMKVLSHTAVNGFLTHCGWNSVSEGIMLGKTFIGYPIFYDQLPNCKFLVDDLKIGFRVKKTSANDEVVPRDVIEEVVMKLMDLESEDNREMASRARKIMAVCKGPLDEGGSSSSSIVSFVKDVIDHASSKI